MRIEGDTLVFKSVPQFYSIEEAGRKPNTVRIISDGENEAIRGWYGRTPTRRIKIINVDGEGEFTRAISNISFIGELVGQYLMVVSWIHPGADR